MKTQSGEVRIAFFLERHPTRDRDPWLSPVTEGIVEGLRERMAQVDLIVPENSLWDLSELRPKHDLFVLKSETAMALSLAGALTVAGAEVVNSFRAASLVRDKVAHVCIPAARHTG